MKVLVTGTEGYIGSRLMPILFGYGLDVVGLDAAYYCDGFVHPAEHSNDPLGQNNPKLTHEINHGGSVAIAKAARAAGIRHFVDTSSCSVYGAGTGDFLDQTAKTNPQTAYAECKVLVE